MGYGGVDILDPVAKEGPCDLGVKVRRKREHCGHEVARGEHRVQKQRDCPSPEP